MLYKDAVTKAYSFYIRNVYTVLHFMYNYSPRY